MLTEIGGKACVVAVNKWDAIDKTDGTYETFAKSVAEASTSPLPAPCACVAGCPCVRSRAWRDHRGAPAAGVAAK